MPPLGGMGRQYSLPDKSCEFEPRVQECCKVDLVFNLLCNGNYSNCVVYNKGYCFRRVKHDFNECYVNPIVLHISFLKMEYFFVF